MLHRTITEIGDATRAADGMPLPRRRWAMVAIALGTALAVIDGSIVTVALPTLARDLGVHASSACRSRIYGLSAPAIEDPPK